MMDGPPKRSRFDPRNPRSYLGYKRYLEPTEDTDVPRRTQHRDRTHAAVDTPPSPQRAEGNTPPSPQHADNSSDNEEAEVVFDQESNEEIMSYSNASPQDNDFEEAEAFISDESSDEESMYGGASPIPNAFRFDEELQHEEDDPQSDHEPTADEEVNRNETEAQRKKLFKDYDLDGHVIPNVSLSRFEILVMIIHFIMRFKLSYVCLKALIELVNVILGAVVIPPSAYIFNKIFASDTERKFYLYCKVCLRLLGESNACKKDKIHSCPSCNEPVNVQNLNDGNFFVAVSMADQIRDRLERPGGEALLSYRQKRDKNDDYIADVFDGISFKELEAGQTDNSSFITLLTSLDGANVALSNNKSIWPIQYFINEIPPEDRFHSYNIMCSGFWFGRSKISMVTYLSFIVEELNRLATYGVKWHNSVLNQDVITKVYCLLFCADLPARAKVLMMKNFNGKYSCHLCLHEGDPEGPMQVRFGYRPTYALRTDKEIREDMEKAQRDKEVVRGMKGISPLCYFPGFQLPFCVSIDYMHNQLLGVAKYCVEKIWTNTENELEDFYLDNRKKFLLDKRILALRPPSNISRDPRPFTHFSMWKANEWRSWLFHYGPVVLKGILPNKYYHHFCLLSAGIFFFCQEKIERERIECYGNFLLQFVKQFEQLYGRSRMTHNVHLTAHIKEIVTSNGPLWCYSLFPLEGGNGFLLDLIQAAQGVQQQLVTKYCTYSSLPKLLAMRPELANEVYDFCEFILPSRHLKKAERCSEIIIKGNKFQNPFLPSEEEWTAIISELPEINIDEIYLINKIIHRRQVFSIENPDRTTKRDNSFVVLQNGRYAKVLKFIFISSLDNEKVYMIGKLLKFEENCAAVFGTAQFHMKVCQAYTFENELIVVPADTILKKCFFMTRIRAENDEEDQLSFISPLPNNYEKD